MLGRFRRQFLHCWLKWRFPLNSEIVLADEPLAHYLFSRKNEFSVVDGKPRLKAAGLIPFKHVELSVFRMTELPPSLVWTVGDVFVGTHKKKPALARAFFPASLLEGTGLSAVKKEPPVRHADLLGWPPEKDRQLSIAQQLIKGGANIEVRDLATS